VLGHDHDSVAVGRRHGGKKCVVRSFQRKLDRKRQVSTLDALLALLAIDAKVNRLGWHLLGQSDLLGNECCHA
jgi:hypothetical protein